MLHKLELICYTYKAQMLNCKLYRSYDTWTIWNFFRRDSCKFVLLLLFFCLLDFLSWSTFSCLLLIRSSLSLLVMLFLFSHILSIYIKKIYKWFECIVKQWDKVLYCKALRKFTIIVKIWVHMIGTLKYFWFSKEIIYGWSFFWLLTVFTTIFISFSF
jgi:hypothetical protein